MRASTVLLVPTNSELEIQLLSPSRGRNPPLESSRTQETTLTSLRNHGPNLSTPLSLNTHRPNIRRPRIKIWSMRSGGSMNRIIPIKADSYSDERYNSSWHTVLILAHKPGPSSDGPRYL
ncbi:hypothetical protein H2248_012335 [Termitomyces sp. 'cryptogamus']|nr:hypothetical protein H2248_012335 [Termitomyces sp. 'cryptogamus']